MNFYIFKEAGKRTALHVSPDIGAHDSYDITLGRVDPGLIVCNHESRSKPMDVITTTQAVMYIVSQKVIDVFTNHKAKGWRTYPVKVFDKDECAVTGYYGLAISGRSGPIDHKKSEIVTLPPPAPGGRSSEHYRGSYFDASTWDGSDIFCPEGTTMVFVTEPLARALNGLSNIELIDQREDLTMIWSGNKL